MTKRKGVIAGVGINDADYKVTKLGGHCPYYARWKGVIERCYTSRGKYKSYDDCSVCDDWIYFMNFKKWMEKQEWEGLQLDKDCFSVEGAKIYSPETCVFLPSYVNNAFSLVCTKDRGECMLGVHKCKDSKLKPYRTSIVPAFTKGNKKLGNFRTPLEAHREYQKAKVFELEKVINRYRAEVCFDERVGQALYEKILKLRSDYEQGIETKTL